MTGHQRQLALRPRGGARQNYTTCDQLTCRLFNSLFLQGKQCVNMYMTAKYYVPTARSTFYSTALHNPGNFCYSFMSRVLLILACSVSDKVCIGGSDLGSVCFKEKLDR